MALTLAQIRARDQARRRAAQPPPPETAGGEPAGQRSLIITAGTASIQRTEPWTTPAPTIITGARLSCGTPPVGGPLTIEVLRGDEVVDTISLPDGQPGTVAHKLVVPIEKGVDIAANVTAVGASAPAQRVRLQIDLGP